LRLENRAVTALQFVAAADAASRLVVADAARRLETIPTSVLPLGGSASPRWAAAAALAISTLVVIGFRDRAAQPPAAGTAGESSSDAPAQGGRAGTQQTAASRGSAGDGRLVAARGPDGAPLAPAQDANQSASSEASSDTRPRTRNGSDAASLDDASGRPAAAVADSNRRAENPSTSERASGARDGVDANGARGAASTGAAAGRGAGAAARRGPAGGGVADGVLTGVAAERGIPAPLPANGLQAAEYRRAYARAEAAMAKERIPPRLRPYVRDYFLALRPEPGR
jgi:hypothetical protein